jgi:cytochrome c oxidase subunit 1
VYNFKDIPQVEHRDPLWAEKYGIDEEEHDVNVTLGGSKVGTVDAGGGESNPHTVLYHQAPPVDDDHGVHLPNPSFYPLVAAAGFAFIAVGMLFDNPVFHIGGMGVPVITALGVIIMVGGVFGWSFEPAD